MAGPNPGSGGVPYTHREVFLAAEYAVGKGLETYAGLSDTALRSKSTFPEIVSDFDTLTTVRDTTDLWDELVVSQIVKHYAESEFTVEYLAESAPSINTNTYQDVQDLMSYSNLNDADKKTIELLTKIHMANMQLWSDKSLYNRLIKNHKNWMEYFINLTRHGDPVADGKLDEESMTELALHTVGEYQSNLFEVFNDKSNRDKFLKQTNFMNTAPVDNHSFDSNVKQGWIRTQSLHSGVSWSVSPFSTNRWISSSYSNGLAVRLLNEVPELRKAIAAGKYTAGKSEDFEMYHLFDGTVSENLWELGSDLDHEIIKTASANQSSAKSRSYANSSDSTNYYAKANISTGSTLTMHATGDSGELHANWNSASTQSISSGASIETHNINVTNKNTVTFEIDSGQSFTQEATSSTKYYTNYGSGRLNTESNSSVTVQVGSESKTWNSGESPDNKEFDISDKDRVNLKLVVSSDADGASRGDYYSTTNSADAKLVLDDIDIS